MYNHSKRTPAYKSNVSEMLTFSVHLFIFQILKTIFAEICNQIYINIWYVLNNEWFIFMLSN